MPDECPPDFDNLTCVPDHLTTEDRERALRLILAEVQADAEKADPKTLERARVWLTKCQSVDIASARMIINALVSELSVLQYARLMSIPESRIKEIISNEALGMSQTISYEKWMDDLDNMVERRFGVSIHDLPDMNFRDAYDDGKTPREFFKEDFRDALEEEGYDVEELLGGG